MTTESNLENEPTKVETLDQVVIRFAGDSGDGMQVTGDRFTDESARCSAMTCRRSRTIRPRSALPAGTLAGVSAFQIHISDHEILTPGDAPNVLVAMNPAALKANVSDLPTGGTLMVNADSFDERDLAKAGYETNPLEDGSLSRFRIYEIPMTSLTLEACKPTGAKPHDAERSKNFFALGLLSWLYHRPIEDTERWIVRRYGKLPIVAEANTLAFRAGYNFGETAEIFESSYEIGPAEHLPGTYTNVTGNVALAWGLLAAAHLAKLPLFLGSYPITPASDILHELSKHKKFGVRTLQAEDEIAGIGAALGAAFGGALGVTTTSGPGIDLKAETVGLAVSLELPLLIVDIQRGGPSTGLPTKTEQSDLLHAMFGRHGEAPVPIVAAKTPSHCFEAAIEAARIALKYRTPVYLLSDGYLANGAEPWRLPDVESLPDISVEFATEPNAVGADGEPAFWPFKRDPHTLAWPWAIPGTPGLEHRIGGLEKQDGIGTVSYEPANHQVMVHARAGEDRRHRQGTCASRRRRSARRRQGASPGLGLHLRGDHSRSKARSQGRQVGRPAAPGPFEPFPAEPRRGPAGLRGDPRPRGQSRPPDPPRTLRLPRGREGAVQGRGDALQGRRYPAGHPRRDRAPGLGCRR